jgi:RNA polymerase sigma-70 factor (ECF subfamily)
MILESVTVGLEAGTVDTVVPSLKELYEAEFAFVWRNLRRFGVREGDLRDAAQDVFVVVHRRLGDFEGRSSIRWWLYGVVKRVAAQTRRTRRRHPVDALDDMDSVEGASGAPDENAERAQALELFASLLDQIDEDQRDAVILSDLEDFTAPEIASMLGCNVNTVYSRLRLGRAKLRSAFERSQNRTRSEP